MLGIGADLPLQSIKIDLVGGKESKRGQLINIYPPLGLRQHYF